MMNDETQMLRRLDFQIWLERMGYNRKQVREAAGRIGMTGATIASQTSSGTRELTVTERLAMAAVRAGLPPWTPETDQEIADLAVTAATKIVRKELDPAAQARLIEETLSEASTSGDRPVA